MSNLGLFFINVVWWVVVFFTYRVGKKVGRRIGYQEGWGHGRSDTLADAVAAKSKRSGAPS